MAGLLEFTGNVTTAFGKLSTATRALIGGTIGIYLLTKYGHYFQLGAFALMKTLQHKEKKPFKKGVVYLHMFPRNHTKQVPNLSPYAMKVETWLRLTKISYEVVETLEFSKSTQQLPYIIYNGQEISDSELIIDFLVKEFKLDADNGLTKEQKGLERAFITMLDDKTSFAYALYRYNYEFSAFLKFFQPVGTPYLLKKMLLRSFQDIITTKCRAQGIGRKPRDTVVAIANADLKALSSYLGDKKFLMGDQITRVDCCAFGHLSQILYVDLPYPFKTFVDAECPNLNAYMARIKGALWRDWNDIVDEGTF